MLNSINDKSKSIIQKQVGSGWEPGHSITKKSSTLYEWDLPLTHKHLKERQTPIRVYVHWIKISRNHWIDPLIFFLLSLVFVSFLCINKWKKHTKWITFIRSHWIDPLNLSFFHIINDKQARATQVLGMMFVLFCVQWFIFLIDIKFNWNKRN